MCAKRFNPLDELELLKDADPRYRLAQGLVSHKLFESFFAEVNSPTPAAACPRSNQIICRGTSLTRNIPPRKNRQ